MPKATTDYTNPKRKKPVTDKFGNYDMDGVTQAEDFEVIVASDKTAPNKPAGGFGFSGLKHKLSSWLANWDDSKQR